MIAIFLKASIFIFVFALAYVLKRIGFFGKSDYKVLNKIMVNITLPATVLGAFGNFEKSSVLYLVVLIALVCNVFLLFVGYFASRKKDNSTKAFYMLNTPDYNIGAFAMPFAQNFFGPLGVITTCMFDMGNAIMCTGGSYMLTSSIIDVEKGQKITAKQVAKKLFSSVPFDTYLIMFIITFVGIKLPAELINFVAPIGNAHGFVAMFMIGLMLEINVEPQFIKEIKEVFKVLGLRYIFAAILAYIFYFHTPFELVIRQALTVVAFAPASIVASSFTEKAGGSAVQASLAVSISILISVVIMTVLMVGMGIG